MSRRAVSVALAALCALAPACAALPACPARGGPAWTEWSSSHFVLLTDLEAPAADAALRRLEELRAAVLVAAWRRAPEPRHRLTVVAFRRDGERRVFVPAGFVATLVATRPGQAPYVVESGDEQDEVFTDTLVRALALQYGVGGRVPWVDEGLARYLESLRREPDGTVTWGGPNETLFRGVTAGRLTSFENLWAPVTPETRARFTATSWLAVHYLFNREPERFSELQRRLVEGADAREAWRATFPDLTPEEMNARLAGYVFHTGQFTIFKTRLPPAGYVSQATPLDDDDVHALRALLFATMPEPRADLARAEIAEAQRLDPTHVLAAFVQRAVLRDDEDDLELPKRLIARHPQDARAWLLLARARALRHELAAAKECWEEARRFGATPEAQVAVELRVARPAD